MISQRQNLEVTQGIKSLWQESRGSMSDQLRRKRWRGREQIKFYQKIKIKTAIWGEKKTSSFIVNLSYIFYFQKHDKASRQSSSQTVDPCWRNFRLLSEFYWQTFCLYFTAVNKFCHCLEPSSFQHLR